MSKIFFSKSIDLDEMICNLKKNYYIQGIFVNFILESIYEKSSLRIHCYSIDKLLKAIRKH